LHNVIILSAEAYPSSTGLLLLLLLPLADQQINNGRRHITSSHLVNACHQIDILYCSHVTARWSFHVDQSRANARCSC